MKFNWLKIMVISIAFIMTSSAAMAFDYQDWVPLVPENISEFEKKGEPNGMNMEKRGQAWSALEQKYSNKDGDALKLSIVTGKNAPGMQEFKAMKQFKVENDKEKTKTLDVKGRNSVLNIKKKAGENSLLIPASDETLVVIATEAVDSEDEMTSLAADVPIDDIAAAVE
ncbi:MAG: hypothetical protein ACLFS7_07930 [Desulfosudaceae bacterium]